MFPQLWNFPEHTTLKRNSDRPHYFIAVRQDIDEMLLSRDTEKAG